MNKNVMLSFEKDSLIEIAWGRGKRRQGRRKPNFLKKDTFWG
jgi:hypothetical protein